MKGSEYALVALTVKAVNEAIDRSLAEQKAKPDAIQADSETAVLMTNQRTQLMANLKHQKIGIARLMREMAINFCVADNRLDRNQFLNDCGIL